MRKSVTDISANRVKIATAFLLINIFALVANAQVESCNGVFTNRPCELPSKSDVVATSSPEVLELKQSSQRKTLLHNLTMKSIRYKRAHGVDLDISSAGNTCLAQSVDDERCREEVQKLDDRLEQRKSQALENMANKKQLLTTPAPQTVNTVQKTVVIVNRPVVVRPIPILPDGTKSDISEPTIHN